MSHDPQDRRETTSDVSARPAAPYALGLTDLVDVPMLQAMMDDFYELTSIPMSLVDLEGTVIVGAGWQDACTLFHRANPEACAACTESDTVLTADIPVGEAKLYHCKNGMWDAATPIAVGDTLVGRLFTGQFFFDDEPIDLGFFGKQAQRYEFDEPSYLAAVQAVPRLSRATVDTGLRFLTNLSTMISQLSFSTIERERAARFSDALAKVTEILLSALAFEDVVARLVREVSNVAGADKSLVIEVSGEAYTVTHVRNVRDDLIGTTHDASFFPGFAIAAASGRPVLIEDNWTDPRTNKDFVVPYGLHAFQLLPLTHDGKTTHVLALAYDEPRSFDEYDYRSAERMAASMSVALDKARLFEIERERARLSEALAEIDHAIHSARKPEEIFKRVVVEAAQVLGCESSALDLREDGAWVIRYVYRFPESSVGNAFSDDDVPLAALAARTRKPVAIDDAFNDSRVDPDIQRAYNVRSVMVTPLIVQDTVQGLLFFNYHECPHSFSQVEVAFAEHLSASLSLAIANARLYQAEHRIADRLQEALLALPGAVDGIEFAHSYDSATELARVGGDFYDIFRIDESRIGITIGDVAGKGLDAAVLTSLAKNTIRAHANERGKSPCKVLALTNDVVFRSTPSYSFVTAFFGILDTSDGRLVYANGGHPAGAIVREGVDPGRLQATGPLLGAFEDLDFEESEVCLNPGEMLFLYTDGLTEARRDREQYGEDRLFECLANTKSASLATFVREVIDDVLCFTGSQLRDDLAVLAVRRVADTSEPT